MSEKKFLPTENEKKENLFEVEVTDGFSENILNGILEIEDGCFPADWHYEDAESYYKEALENSNNINIILKKEGRIIGYLLAIPHNDLLEEKEFMEADPDFKEDKEKYYIETLGIIPENKGGAKVLLDMFKKLIEEARTRYGIHKFSFHARVNNGLSLAIQKSLGRVVTKKRRIDNWKFYNDEEPTDYLELEYEK